LGNTVNRVVVHVDGSVYDEDEADGLVLVIVRDYDVADVTVYAHDRDFGSDEDLADVVVHVNVPVAGVGGDFADDGVIDNDLVQDFV
jgi:hypothetical protein